MNTESEQEASIWLEESTPSLVNDIDYQGSITDESVLNDFASFQIGLQKSIFQGLRSTSQGPVNEERSKFQVVEKPDYQYHEAIRVETQLFDLRTKSCVRERAVALPANKKDIAKLLGTEQLTEILPDGAQRIIILGVQSKDVCFFIRAGLHQYCVKLSESANVQVLIEQIQQAVWQQYTKSADFYRQISLDSKLKPWARPMCLIHNNKMINNEDLRKLRPYTVLVLSLNMTLEWQVSHHFKLFCDKQYFFKCATVTPLTEVKQTFLQIYKKVEPEGFPLDSSFIWFTQDSKVITETLLIKTFNSIVTRCLEGNDSLTHDDKNLLILSAVRGSPDKAVLEVFTHFQPTNSFCVELEMKCQLGESKGIGTRSSGILVLPPTVSKRQLYEEVSKVVREEPASLRIIVGTQKLSSIGDIGSVLKSTNCKVYVSPKMKITLFVQVVEYPSKSHQPEIHEVLVYSYDYVRSIKTEMSQKLAIPLYKIDILLNGQPLADSKTFSENRIKDRDMVDANVYTNRLAISVRMPNRKVNELVVDDCWSCTVGHIKAFARTVAGVEPFHNCEITAIVKDCVVSDDDILGHILCKDIVPKLLLIRIENECFTSAYKDKIAVVATSSDGTVNEYSVAMSDGEYNLFYGSLLAQDQLKDLVLKRRQSAAVGPQTAMHGIKVNHKEHFDDVCGRLYSFSACSSPAPSVSSPIASSQQLPVQSPGQSDTSIQIPGQVKRPSSVRFKFGRDAQDKIGLADENDHMMVERKQELSSDEEDSGTLTNNEEDKEFTAPATPLRKRQRGRSDNRASQLIKVNRSRSCPTFQLETISPNLQGVHRSSSESTMSRTLFVQESYHLRDDGTYTLCQNVSAEMHGLTEQQAYDRMMTSPSLACSTSDVPSQPLSSMMLQSCDQQNHIVLLQDPAYKYVKEPVIRYVAHHLGANGMFIIRALEVSEPVIEKARAAHPNDLFERNFYCLRHWCTSTGKMATKDTLKSVLMTNGRKDLADGIDEMDSDDQPTVCPTTEQSVLQETEH